MGPGSKAFGAFNNAFRATPSTKLQDGVAEIAEISKTKTRSSGVSNLRRDDGIHESSVRNAALGGMGLSRAAKDPLDAVLRKSKR